MGIIGLQPCSTKVSILEDTNHDQFNSTRYISQFHQLNGYRIEFLILLQQNRQLTNQNVREKWPST